MRFSEGSKSAAREKPLTIALPDREDKVLVRPTGALEDIESRKFAMAQVKAAGAPDARDGDAIYDASFWAHVVATAFLDVDSSASGRVKYFTDAAEVLRELPTESIAYLFQSQQQWQEEASPNYKALSPGQLVGMIEKLAKADGDVFFSRCSPSTQSSLARFMAVLLESLPDTSWRNGSRSTDSPTKGNEKPTNTPRKLRQRPGAMPPKPPRAD